MPCRSSHKQDKANRKCYCKTQVATSLAVHSRDRCKSRNECMSKEDGYIASRIYHALGIVQPACRLYSAEERIGEESSL